MSKLNENKVGCTGSRGFYEFMITLAFSLAFSVFYRFNCDVRAFDKLSLTIRKI